MSIFSTIIQNINIWGVFVFLFGMVGGSFLNCLIYRSATQQSVWRGRSFCPHCHHLLKWRDLIPVFSFLSLKGRCRYCGQRISWQYPLVEIFTGLIFLLIFNWQFSSSDLFSFEGWLKLLYFWLMAGLLIVIFVADLRYYLIPDQIIYPAVVLGLFYPLVANWGWEKADFLLFILSASAAAGFFALLYLFSRGRWLGLADIKLVFLIGLLLGWPKILIGLFLAFFLGALVGSGLIVAGRKKLKSEIPFAPFLIIGLILALIWGEALLAWYQSFFMLK
ncbi:MAG: prepilin peptidase [Minisyncoccales bacterium]